MFDSQPTREWVEVLPNVEVVARANSLSFSIVLFDNGQQMFVFTIQLYIYPFLNA